MGKRIRTEFVICPLSVCPHPKATLPPSRLLGSPRRGVPGTPGKALWGSAPDTNFSPSRSTGAPPAGGRTGASRQARPAGAPQSLGMLFPAFPWKERVCVVGPGTAAPPALPGGVPVPRQRQFGGRCPRQGQQPGFRLLPLPQKRVFTALNLNQTAFMRRGRASGHPMANCGPTWCLHPAIVQATSRDVWVLSAQHLPLHKIPSPNPWHCQQTGLYTDGASSD